ncbi:MAG: DUF3179 domain-containing protein [Caldilineales bacterium]|nr:DUF3179 domain-containing protein [Caldilineales bacterium]
MHTRPLIFLILSLAAAALLAACAPVSEPVPTAAPATPTAPALPEYKIVSLLPRDAIPAIFDPEFLSAADADAEYDPNELVIGVEIDGDARAYSIPYLSSREIVNDTVGGRRIAVTW